MKTNDKNMQFRSFFTEQPQHPSTYKKNSLSLSLSHGLTLSKWRWSRSFLKPSQNSMRSQYTGYCSWGEKKLIYFTLFPFCYYSGSSLCFIGWLCIFIIQWCQSLYQNCDICGFLLYWSAYKMSFRIY